MFAQFGSSLTSLYFLLFFFFSPCKYLLVLLASAELLQRYIITIGDGRTLFAGNLLEPGLEQNGVPGITAATIFFSPFPDYTSYYFFSIYF